ncbi:MAG: TraM recognition domain-containing protein [Acidimicrobiia bacterium]
MTRALGPRVGLGPQATLPLAILAVFWIPVALAAAVWVGGHAASAATGHGWTGPPLSLAWGLDLVRHGPAASWPGTPAGLVWALGALLVAAVVFPVAIGALRWHRRRPTPGDPLASLARAGDVAALAPPGVAARAVQLRPSLAGTRPKDVAAADAGVPLGRLRPRGPQLRASWEDVIVAFMAPRGGKTSSLAVPIILSAPGAVVATSNKADLWALTAAVRGAGTGQRVWVFDPQRLAQTRQSWWWNPLAGVTTVEQAQRLAGHFIVEVRGDRQHEFWSSAAEDLLTSLFLAAGATGRTLVDVYDWLNKPTLPVPVELLRQVGHEASASGLAGRQAGAVETREGIYETARTAARCLRDANILAWVTPPAEALDEFDAVRFAATRETLYLLTKDDAGGAAPLVAAFADRVMHDATRLAERAGGRLDPPLVVVLDEAANICKIADLPKLYSHLGSRGVLPITILQSYPQGVGVWGANGMDTLWGAATVKVVGTGMDDDQFLERVSRLVGEHDVATRGVHYGGGMGASYGENITLRRQRILPVEDLRRLPKGTAVVFATGCRPAMIELEPWFTGPRKAEIAAAEHRALAELTARAGDSEKSPGDTGAGDSEKSPRRPDAPGDSEKSPAGATP